MLALLTPMPILSSRSTASAPEASRSGLAIASRFPAISLEIPERLALGALCARRGHPLGLDAERSELKRAFCSSFSEL